jgi:predicted N-acyltransferase
VTGRGYELRIVQRVREIPRDQWDALVGPEGSPFVEWTWLDALEETGCVGGESGWTPAHLTLWQDQKLVALAPSYLKGHSEGEFVFDWSWADLADRLGVAYYPKLVVAVPFTPVTGDRVLTSAAMSDAERASATAIVGEAARAWCKRVGASGVHVLFTGEAETSAWEASGYLRRDGYQFHWFRDGASSWPDYLARFTSKQRNQIKRELRGIEQRGVVVETLAAEGHTREMARTMHAFYATTIEKHGVWGRLYLNVRFFEAVVDRFRDRLAWVVARDRASGEVLGGAFNVMKGRRLYGRYWGAGERVDVPYLHFAVCYYEGIRFCIERGLDVFEPGAGGEHKRARGFVPTRTRSAHWIADGRMRNILVPWLARERDRVTRVVEADPDDEDLTES